MSNIQAVGLCNLDNNSFIYSELIELSKKEFKKIKSETWLEIDKNYLNIVLTKSKKIFSSAKISFYNECVILNNINNLNKKFKDKSSKNSFYIKIKLDYSTIFENMAICKNGCSVTIIRDKKNFAKAVIYFNDDMIFLNIKEVL